MPYKDKDKESAYHNQYGMYTRKWYKEHGICTACGKNRADKGFATCLQCRMDERERGATRTVTEEQREKNYERIEERRQRLLTAGLCEECGKRPCGKYRRCEICRNKINARRRKKRKDSGTIPSEDRWNGLQCGRCLKPTQNGAKLCPDCLAKMPKNGGNKHNGFSDANAIYWASMQYRKAAKGEKR